MLLTCNLSLEDTITTWMAVSKMSRQHSGPLNKKFIQIGHRSTASNGHCSC